MLGFAQVSGELILEAVTLEFMPISSSREKQHFKCIYSKYFHPAFPLLEHMPKVTYNYQLKIPI